MLHNNFRTVKARVEESGVIDRLINAGHDLVTDVNHETLEVIGQQNYKETPRGS